MKPEPSPFDIAIYAREMACHLAAMADDKGLKGLATLFRAAANEAAEAAFSAQSARDDSYEADEDAA